jgi:alpha-D-ribose 1-methylphosphonate 5-phosphate C-P lyase
MKFLTKEDRYDVFTVPSKGGLKGIHKSVSLKRILNLIKLYGEMRVLIYRVTTTKAFGVTLRKRYYFKPIDPLNLLISLATKGLLKNETP